MENVRKGDFICIIYGWTFTIILRKGNTKTVEERKRKNKSNRESILLVVMTV